MSYAVQPPILNLKGEEHAARPKHAPGFRKSAILQCVRTQVMKHQDRNRRGKSPIRKRQGRRIALNHCCIRAIQMRAQLCRKRVVVLETGHASSEAPQLLRRLARRPAPTRARPVASLAKSKAKLGAASPTATVAFRRTMFRIDSLRAR